MSVSNNFVKLKDQYEEVDNIQEECLFCFDKVDLEKSFIVCNTCEKYCHANCYTEWFNRKNDTACIFCQQNTLIYYETKITMLASCLSFIWKKKPKYSKKSYKIK